MLNILIFTIFGVSSPVHQEGDTIFKDRACVLGCFAQRLHTVILITVVVFMCTGSL